MEAQNRIRELEQELAEFRTSCQPRTDTSELLSRNMKSAIDDCANDFGTLDQISQHLAGNRPDVGQVRDQLNTLLQERPTMYDDFGRLVNGHHAIVNYQKGRAAFHRNRARNLREERNRATIELTQIHECAARWVENGENLSIEEACSIIAALEASKEDAIREVERLTRSLQDLPVQIEPGDTNDQADIEQDTAEIHITKGRELSVMLGNLNSLITAFKLTTRQADPQSQPQQQPQQPQQSSTVLQDKISDLELEMNGFKDENEALKDELADCKRHGKILQDEISKANGRLPGAQNNIRQDPEFMALRRTHQRCLDDLKRARAETGRQADEIQALKWDLHHERTWYTTAMNRNREVEAEISQLKKDMEKLQDDNRNIVASNTRNEAKLRADISRLESQIKNLNRHKDWEEENMRLEAKITLLQQQNQAIGGNGSQIIGFMNEIRDLQMEKESKDRECEEEKQRLDSEIARLQQELQQAKASHAVGVGTPTVAPGNLRRQTQLQESEIQTLQTRHADEIRAKDDQIKRITAELKTLKEEIENQGRECKEEKEALGTYITTLEEREKEQQISHAREIDAHTTENTNLRGQRDAQESECAEEKDRLNAQIQDLNIRINNLTQTNNEIQIELDGLRGRPAGDPQVEVESRATIARLEQQAQDLEAQLAACRAETWQQRRDRSRRPPPSPGPPPPPKPQGRKRMDPALRDMDQWRQSGQYDKNVATGKRRRT